MAIWVYASPYEERQLFFREQDKAGSSAEVDNVVRVDSQIVPIEVKAGATGRLRSLQQFLERKAVNLGLRVSERPLQLERKILSIPFYRLGQLPQLLSAE